MLLTEKEARALCEKLLGYVTADDAQVSAGSGISSHLRFGANSLRTSGRQENLSIGVTVWMDGRRGAALTNETDEASLEAVVRQAEELARISPVDREYLPTLGPQDYTPVEGFVEATANVSPAGRAKAISDILGQCEKENVVGAGLHYASGTAGASATKNGNFEYERRSLVSLGMTARTPQGDASGFFLRNHHDVARLDTARVAREAIGKAKLSRGAAPVDPGAWTVVLEPQAVADLLGGFGFMFAFNARSADEGRSPFSAPGGKTRVGERIFDERLSLLSDPWHPELPGSPSAQGGIPAKRIYLVRDGVLESLIYNRFWAQQKKTEPTPGPVNTIVESSAEPAGIEEMIKDTKKGLLVSRFWYIRPVDPRTMLFTGLTRDGLWLIENGKIARPASNLRFNQSILHMLARGNVELIGAVERVGSSEAQGRASALLPALKLKAFHFTSQSEAV